eukprot:COSAG01_NODE_3754_length_5726_cov_2.944198_6_plen_171_part_00
MKKRSMSVLGDAVMAAAAASAGAGVLSGSVVGVPLGTGQQQQQGQRQRQRQQQQRRGRREAFEDRGGEQGGGEGYSEGEEKGCEGVGVEATEEGEEAEEEMENGRTGPGLSSLDVSYAPAAHFPGGISGATSEDPAPILVPVILPQFCRVATLSCFCAGPRCFDQKGCPR